ncbi:MAG: hypothetical protein ACK5W0_17915 [Labrys sp. (in: a-proteobacteria)]|jgi:sarcosine oxidase subunit gamma
MVATPLRRSPLHARLEGLGAHFSTTADALVAEGLGTADPLRLAIADLSALPRLGFKGRGTIPAMQARGVVVEGEPNRAFRQADGGLCLVLAPGEVILLGPLSGEGARLDALLAGWRIEDEERTYPLLRRDSHAWFAITGGEAPAMFAKICGIDLRLHKFADLSIAQTSVAKLTGIVTRAEIGATPVFHLLADSASADYCLTCLLDAADEFGGGLVGIDAVRSLAGT